MIYSTAEMLGGFVTAPLDKIWSSRTFAYVAYGVGIFCLISIIPFKYIPNKAAMVFFTAIPIILSGMVASMYYASLISSSSRVGPMYSTAIAIGVGLSSITIQVIQDLITGVFSGLQGDEYDNALILNAIAFYAVACLILIACIFCWRWFEKNVPEAITV